jgi:hypothetical protein
MLGSDGEIMENVSRMFPPHPPPPDYSSESEESTEWETDTKEAEIGTGSSRPKPTTPEAPKMPDVSHITISVLKSQLPHVLSPH